MVKSREIAVQGTIVIVELLGQMIVPSFALWVITVCQEPDTLPFVAKVSLLIAQGRCPPMIAFHALTVITA